MPESKGLCKCGCGQPAPLAARTRNERGITRGHPLDYIPSHRPLKRKYVGDLISSIEPAYCMCGCGGTTPVATATRKDRGHKRGVPLKYLKGHYQRRKTKAQIRAKKSRLSVIAEESRKAEGKAQVKCRDCGSVFQEKSTFGYSVFVCPACKEKIAESKNSEITIPSCTWCEEDSIAHSDKSVKNRLYTCLKHWEKLKYALHQHFEEKESALASSMKQFSSDGI